MSDFENKSAFGDRLMELRKDMHMNQNDLAKQWNMAASSISNLETGRRTPNAHLICQAAKFFGVTSDYLLGLSKTRMPVLSLAEEFADGQSVEELLKMLLTLDGKRRHAFLILLKDAYFFTQIHER